MDKVENQGSVRVDLLGGTLDIHPMNLIIPQCVTLNVATSLKAKVSIQKSTSSQICFNSLDYKKSYIFEKEDFTPRLNNKKFAEMSLLASLLGHFMHKLKQFVGLDIEISSGAPAGSGLGGSSAMGITFYKALSDLFEQNYSHEKILKDVMDIEAKVLNCGPTGYQDYYPALYGGVLALFPTPGHIEVEQLFSEELKSYLETNATLVFSGKSRFSAINNWEVYKSFFDRNSSVEKGLAEIASLSSQAWQAIKSGEFDRLCHLMIQEGALRKTLFSGIETQEMSELLNDLHTIDSTIGLKVCGAGGGGCFLIVHPNNDKESILNIVDQHKMEALTFEIERPLK